MIQLGTHKIGVRMPSVSVHSCSDFAWIFRSKNLLFYKKIIKSGCGKGCGHKKGSNGVAYDDSYSDKF